MCREIERVCVRVRRDIKGPLPIMVRLWLWYGLSSILSGFPFSNILFSSILSSGILSGIRFGLHRGNPRAATSISRLKQV